MAGGVLKATAQIIISVFADWSLNGESAKRYGAIKDRLRIGHIDVQMDFSRPMLSAAATQHDDAVVDTNLPIHLALSCAPEHVDQIASAVAGIWKEMVPTGSVVLKDASDIPGWGRYIAKAITPQTCDLLLMS